MRCACIDIGSNTTRLLVADIDGPDVLGAPFSPVLERRAFTHLGRACRSGEALPAVARAALEQVVREQAAEARALGARTLRVVATAALRRAGDGLATCHALAAAAGAPVELLSEREEARLAFAGATYAREGPLEGPVAVVDVGGGSAQVVVGTCAGGPSWSVSLPLGSGDLAAAHVRSDPPSASELAALRMTVEATLAGVELPRVAHALAVGGSATSLRRLVGPRLGAADLGRALATLTDVPAAVAAQRAGIAAERARLLPAGIAVLAALAQRLGPLEVARGGLREGVLREIAGA